MTCRIGLGTAQFGLNYGVTNATGQVTFDEAGRILGKARELGVRALDTASAYGGSEEVLGKLLRSSDEFNIATKTVPIRTSQIGQFEIALLDRSFKASLGHLCRSKVDTLFVHHAEDLLVPGGDRVYARLEEWQDAGKLARIGVSVYDQRQIENLFDRYTPEVVQLPINVFDQRLVVSGVLSELSRRGVAIHVRSVFLQGLLLREPKQWPGRFEKWQSLVRRYRAYLERVDVSPLTAALSFVSSQPGVETVLIGIETCQQLVDCIAAEKAKIQLNLDEFSCGDLDLIDPRRWF